MRPIIITGIGTDVGKTVVSAIFTTMLKLPYWKPIECGEDSDTAFIQQFSPTFPPTYSFNAPISPHAAGFVDTTTIQLPTKTNIVVETAGGIFTPVNLTELNLDLFCQFNGIFVVVSRHYLGSINHTLLTLNALKNKRIKPLLIFNGSNKESEEAILNFSKVPCIGTLLYEKTLTKKTFQKYAKLWKTRFGTLTRLCRSKKTLF